MSRHPLNREGIITLESAGRGGVGLTVEGGRVRELYEGFATGLHEPHRREETIAHTTNVHLGKA